MKVYFTASSSGASMNEVRDIKSILSILKKYKHTVTNPFYNKVSLSGGNKLDVKISDQDVSDVLRRHILSSDCVIAEISAPSVSLGIQIEFALSRKIPVLCLLRKGENDGLPLLIRDYKNNLLTKSVYDSSCLHDIILKYISNLPNEKVKFNMFIGYKLDKYLSFLSKKDNKPKSEIIRDLLTNKMENDSSFKDTSF